MSKGIKDDANRCRLAIMKHNYSFIRRCNCFVRASQFVLVVHRLLLPLYNAHAHPYLTCYVICDIPFSYYSASIESLVFIVFMERSGVSLVMGGLLQSTMRQPEGLLAVLLALGIQWCNTQIL